MDEFRHSPSQFPRREVTGPFGTPPHDQAYHHFDR